MLHGVSLRHLNSFGLEAIAERYFRATSLGALREALRFEQAQLVLGGGSNLLLTRDVPGLVLQVDLRGISIEPSNIDNEVIVRAGAGENWHDLVLFTLSQNLGGLENLSLIPGCVGASPMQNIGAYGVEIKDHFHSLKALNRHSLQLEEFDLQACAFGYRESVFKRHLAGKYIIVEVSFRLTREEHQLRADYGDLRSLRSHHGDRLAPKHISEAVIQIRQSKLPDPSQIGNSGSFFKNPELSKEEYLSFAERHPHAPSYALPNEIHKIPAAWLIEQAGWKGFRRGQIGVHDRQALVLVNHGGGRGSDLWQLALEIQADVQAKFGISIVPEVNVI